MPIAAAEAAKWRAAGHALAETHAHANPEAGNGEGKLLTLIDGVASEAALVDDPQHSRELLTLRARH